MPNTYDSPVELSETEDTSFNKILLASNDSVIVLKLYNSVPLLSEDNNTVSPL